MSFWIEEKFKKKGKTLFLGLSGGQGCGKTTITGILKIILKKFFKRRICIISIDDFYKTLEDRIKMSKKIHYLFKTRGVPGTHDIGLINNFFKILKNNKFKKISLPKFDKSTDDRLKKKYWLNIKQKPEIVILEGWCVGAKSQSNILKFPCSSARFAQGSNMISITFPSHRIFKYLTSHGFTLHILKPVRATCPSPQGMPSYI